MLLQQTYLELLIVFHHDLIIAKLDIYGFDLYQWEWFNKYFSNKKRVKVGNTFSSWGSNVDHVFSISKISTSVTCFCLLNGVRVATYAHNTNFSIANIMKVSVIKDIGYFPNNFSELFDYLKIYSDISCTFFSGNYIGSANNDKNTISSTAIYCYDLKILFEDLISSFCKRANRKLIAFARINSYICLENKTVMKAFVTSQFGYYPLVWMLIVCKVLCSKTKFFATTRFQNSKH